MKKEGKKRKVNSVEEEVRKLRSGGSFQAPTASAPLTHSNCRTNLILIEYFMLPHSIRGRIEETALGDKSS